MHRRLSLLQLLMTVCSSVVASTRTYKYKYKYQVLHHWSVVADTVFVLLLGVET